ncbi:hypothetical protein COHA_004950 [Chlorella ohadii]|uniref:J domain-containing protein n=1 Tax=Chlorella ohadii TaxID=2649997 RepID=A0AAD5DPF3_9CHLO|nr:hypothetical protein COHA_004950 [Chlorella ohadii]
MHQRAAAAAATGRAYHAMLEQRERQRAAVAEEQERMRSLWASAAANAARQRHVPGPRTPSASVGSSGGISASRLGPAGSGRPNSSTCRAGAATAGPSVRATPPNVRAVPPGNPTSPAAAGSGSQAGQGPQLRDARFWMLYTLQWNRLYEDASGGDDLWGQGFSSAAAAAKQQAGQASGGAAGKASGFGMPAEEFWREFVRESARGWRFQQAYGARPQQGPQQGAQQAQQQEQQAARAGELPTVGAAAGGGSLEQEVRAELARMLSAAGGDLLRFIAALGVAFEPAADRGAALRNARTAFLLRLHPDKLRQAGEREQLQGLLATQVFNTLWAAERGRA